MKLTFPCYLTLEVNTEFEGYEKVKALLQYGLIKDGVSYIISRAVPGEFDRSKEKPFGRPKSES